MEQLLKLNSLTAGLVVGAHGLPVLRYELENGGSVLHVEWQAGPPLEDVKLGFQALIELLRVHRCPIILSDSNGGSGDWSDLIPWVRYEFLPPAIACGVRCLADVLPLDPANSFSVYQWREQTKGLLIHGVFNNLKTAREWIVNELRPSALV